MKSFAIFGDSYSTFEGHIPQGYCNYYPEGLGSLVTDVSHTWWHMLSEKTGARLVFNDSWSGSTVGYRCYGGGDCSGSSSFITRFRRLIDEGAFEGEFAPDTLFIFGGTNDDWCGAPLGRVISPDIPEEELYSVIPSFCEMARLATDVMDGSHVYFIINTGLAQELTDGIAEAARAFGARSVLLTEFDKVNDHPSRTGMEEICRQVMDALSLSDR